MKVLAVSVFAAFALFGGGQAPGASQNHHAIRTLKVVMADPGCHFFLVHGKKTTTPSMAGPIRLKNLDEAALKVASRTKVRFVPVGRAIVLGRGHYVVMMLGQAVDDNYLKLTVR